MTTTEVRRAVLAMGKGDAGWIREDGTLVFATGVDDGFDYSHVILGIEPNGYYYTRVLNVPIDEAKSTAFEGWGHYGMSLAEALLDAGRRVAEARREPFYGLEV